MKESWDFLTLDEETWRLNRNVGKELDCVWNVLAHEQKQDFVFRRNGRVHLNQRGRQFSRLLAIEVCASAVVMLDTPCSEVVWRVLATHYIRQFPLHFPYLSPPCAITFQLDSTTVSCIISKKCVDLMLHLYFVSSNERLWALLYVHMSHCCIGSSQVVYKFADWIKYSLAEITHLNFEQFEDKLFRSTHPWCIRRNFWWHRATWRQADNSPLPEAELNSFKPKPVWITEAFLKAVAKLDSNRVLWQTYGGMLCRPNGSACEASVMRVTQLTFFQFQC
jgi:hypothetical protein